MLRLRSRRAEEWVSIIVRAVLEICAYRRNADSTARERLSEKDLDLRVNASEVSGGASFHGVKNSFLRAQRKRNTIRAWGASALGHDRRLIESASVDHRRDLAIANQNHQ